MKEIHRFVFNKIVSKLNIQSFRGAFIKAIDNNDLYLMHNHYENGLRYAYPLVQYKSINGYPTLIAFDDMGKEIINLLNKENGITLNIRGKKHLLSLNEHTIEDYEPIIEDAPKYYSLTSWLPFVDNREDEYDSFLSLTDKVCFLEDVLVGNMLSFLKGVDYHASDKLFGVISSIDKKYKTSYKHVNFRAFDIHFVSNLHLPDFIGLGKSSSVGMGVIRQLPLPEKYNQYTSTINIQ